MSITVKCAWCGSIMGVKEGELAGGFNISHSICLACGTKICASLDALSDKWDGIERRVGAEKRKGERRRSARHVADTLIALNGVVWVDNKGTDRRRAVRRESDRRTIIKAIFGNVFE